MLSEEKVFINSIDFMDYQELKDLCIKLFMENKELRLNQIANEKINIESYLLYQQIKAEKDAAVKELSEVKSF